MREPDRLVYSTDQPFDRSAKPAVKQRHAAPGKPDDGIVRIARERRKAGIATLITGVAANDLALVAKELKRRCGGGGTAKDGIVMLQGDHRDVAAAYFVERGIRYKLAGG